MNENTEIDRQAEADHSTDGVSALVLQERLNRIIAECHNETSGAIEDRGRDTLLARIIGLAEGSEV